MSSTVVRFAPGLIPVLKHAMHDQKTHGSWASGGGQLYGPPENQWIVDTVWWHGAATTGLTTLSARNAPSRYPGTGRDYSMLARNFATSSYEEAAGYARESADMDQKNGVKEARPVVYQVRPTSLYAEPDPNGALGGWGAAFESMDEARAYVEDGGDVALAFNDDMTIVQEIDPSGFEFGSEPVAKHAMHNQKTHGNWATGTPQGGNGLTHREVYGLQSGTRDTLIRKIYDAEDKFQPNIQRSIPKPFPPSRTEIQSNAEYDKAYKTYSKAFEEWSRESTRNIKSTIGEKYLDGTKAGVQAYVNDVTSADWFVEAFGDGGVIGTPKVSLRTLREAGSYTIGTKNGVGFSALSMDKGYSQAEPIILHELAHYATAISATDSYEGHGVEFARNNIFMANKVIGPEYAAALEKSYREAGVPLG